MFKSVPVAGGKTAWAYSRRAVFPLLLLLCLPMLSACNSAPVAEMRFGIVGEDGQVASDAETIAIFQTAVAHARLLDDGTNCELPRVLNAFGEFMIRHGHKEQALALYQRALSSVRGRHPRVRSIEAQALDGKASVLVAQRRLAAALPAAQQSLAAQASAFGVQSAPWAQAQGLLGDIYYLLGNLPFAEHCYRASLASFLSCRGKTSFETAAACRALAQCLRLQGREAEARPYLRQAYFALEAIHRKKPVNKFL